uniref:Uncharacterized protein n=1 Tax=Pseudo-nitzschia australis TaxID=44445 RepID=A0A6U9ZAD2_9STRA
MSPAARRLLAPGEGQSHDRYGTADRVDDDDNNLSFKVNSFQAFQRSTGNEILGLLSLAPPCSWRRSRGKRVEGSNIDELCAMAGIDEMIISPSSLETITKVAVVVSKPSSFKNKNKPLGLKKSRSSIKFCFNNKEKDNDFNFDCWNDHEHGALGALGMALEARKLRQRRRVAKSNKSKNAAAGTRFAVQCGHFYHQRDRSSRHRQTTAGGNGFSDGHRPQPVDGRVPDAQGPLPLRRRGRQSAVPTKQQRQQRKEKEQC